MAQEEQPQLRLEPMGKQISPLLFHINNGLYRAKVVIGDIDVRGAEETVEEIRAAGG